jgi:hypothetical protein
MSEQKNLTFSEKCDNLSNKFFKLAWDVFKAVIGLFLLGFIILVAIAIFHAA